MSYLHRKAFLANLGGAGILASAGCSSSASFLTPEHFLQQGLPALKNVKVVDDAMALLMRQGGTAAYRNGSTIWRLPEFDRVASPELKQTVQNHAIEIAKNPNVMPCACPGSGSGSSGSNWTEVISWESGSIIGDDGLAIGSLYSETAQTYYYGNASSVGGTPYSGPTYYPSPAPAQVVACGVAAGTWLQTASQAAKAIIGNPSALGGATSAFANAGMTALKAAQAWVAENGEAGEATMAGAIAFISELLLMMTPAGWIALLGAVGGLLVLYYSSKACLEG